MRYLLFFVFFAAACNKPSPAEPLTGGPAVPLLDWKKFSLGGDLSYVNQVQDKGGVFRDSAQVRDPFALLRQRGGNTVRLRLWHNPVWQLPYTGGRWYSDRADVARSIQRAKAQGLAVNLDLHYSDDWADPAKQETPAAWKGLSLPILEDSVYRYTLETLRFLEARQLLPK